MSDNSEGSVNQRNDFNIDVTALRDASKKLSIVNSTYSSSLSRIRKATEIILDENVWKGQARKEFKDTYRILEHYLKEDEEQIINIIDIVNGITELYETTDMEKAKKIAKTIEKGYKAAKGE